MCAKRFHGCPPRCGNRARVECYRAARQADLARMEWETRLFPGDVQLWLESNTVMTFHRWLLDGRKG